MNLRKLILTNNACYKAGRTITPKGIMVHSTGANDPWLKRYVGPDDGLLGRNQYNNHWNQDKPDGRQVCVHAFIGKLVDGTIATYQTLPWNHRGWHAGGSANNTHIGFEICEDGLSDSTYFNKVYQEAVELCVYLCKLYGLTEENILCHSEGYKKGIASNHGDVMHWFTKHGKSMDVFRADVKKALKTINPSPKEADVLYRVRKNRDESQSQKGAYRELENAIRCADDNPGYKVFDKDGKVVYSGKSAPPYAIYTVVKGDSIWKIAKEKLGNGERYTEIKALNGLTSNIIYAGQKLKIPN